MLFLAQALKHLGQAIDRQQQQETQYQSTIVLRGDSKRDPEEPMTSGWQIDPWRMCSSMRRRLRLMHLEIKNTLPCCLFHKGLS